MADKVVFYDIPGKHRGEDRLSSWSFNPWKGELFALEHGVSILTGLDAIQDA
jgi:hypothetical protein